MANETLVPISNTVTVQHTPNTGTNWECVDESSADGDTTYVSGTNDPLVDMYNMSTNSVGGSDTINSVSLYVVAKLLAARVAERSIQLLINGYDVGSPTFLTTSYALYSATTTLHPATGIAWTKAELDSMTVGFRTSSGLSGTGYITQLYVVVDYTPSEGGGESMTALMLALN